ncbi:hypothetical protein B6N60_03978 [Richelia sinica FACHB-800]|uniref:Uncharacterized protein n=1 Tax=Richelia sinica FACHB-800 TaxID=1357546 RepID=A0A975TAT0_9NOST|nr:hypothetical protein B6N60_03978 [Richelia sinica FACHB-800]
MLNPSHVRVFEVDLRPEKFIFSTILLVINLPQMTGLLLIKRLR